MTGPRIAIAHDYLTQRGGAERVVLSLMKAFPDAPIYTTLYAPATTYPGFAEAKIVSSFLNRIPAFRSNHRAALPLLPFAADSMRIDADLVIASSTGWAHGFPTTGRKLVYCHSPARYLYLTDQYLGSSQRSPAGLGLRALRQALTSWDQRAARTVDRYLCNSRVVRERIAAVYGMDATVVPPPFSVDPTGASTEVGALSDWQDGFHLVVSRLLPYKNVDAVIDAFRGLPNERLVVVGRGPLGASLRASAPTNVRLLEGLSDTQLRWVYARARALIAPSYEDFGLTPLEAGAFGVACIALNAGGYLDTIEPGVNGLFFEEPRAELIAEAVSKHSRMTWNEDSIKRHIDQFSEERFVAKIRAAANELLGNTESDGFAGAPKPRG